MKNLGNILQTYVIELQNKLKKEQDFAEFPIEIYFVLYHLKYSEYDKLNTYLNTSDLIDTIPYQGQISEYPFRSIHDLILVFKILAMSFNIPFPESNLESRKAYLSLHSFINKLICIVRKRNPNITSQIVIANFRKNNRGLLRLSDDMIWYTVKSIVNVFKDPMIEQMLWNTLIELEEEIGREI